MFSCQAHDRLRNHPRRHMKTASAWFCVGHFFHPRLLGPLCNEIISYHNQQCFTCYYADSKNCSYNLRFAKLQNCCFFDLIKIYIRCACMFLCTCISKYVLFMWGACGAMLKKLESNIYM